MPKAPINKIIYVLMHLVTGFVVDIDHMSRLVISNADVLADKMK